MEDGENNGLGSRSPVEMDGNGDENWHLSTSTKEEAERWRTEKKRIDEVLEYIREVEEILNLIKPFPREVNGCRSVDAEQDGGVKPAEKPGDTHLENMIKLVDRLRELKECESARCERGYHGTDVKKLREQKRRLKYEEIELRSREQSRRAVCSDNEWQAEIAKVVPFRRSKSTSDDLPQQEKWVDKRKSLCLLASKGKVSKWTKMKEAFHWERATQKTPRRFADESKENGLDREQTPEDDCLFGDFGYEYPLPPPPPHPLLRPQTSITGCSEDFLSVRSVRGSPSSSSSDKLTESAVSDASKGNKTPHADSTCQFLPIDDNDDVDNGVRKSSSEELMLATIPQHLFKDEFIAARLTKSNKTTWGKVKDIIQTRKDSLKRKPKKRNPEDVNRRRQIRSSPSFVDQFDDLDEKSKYPVDGTTPREAFEPSEETTASPGSEICTRKKLTPTLTITVPSTEELRSLSREDLLKRDVSSEENISHQVSCQGLCSEEKPKYIKNKSAQNQRLSRWIKVKRVFLTSSTPPQSPPSTPGFGVSPTGLVKFGFFSDLESDDLSSGEWMEDRGTFHERFKLFESDSQPASLTLIHDDIRKSYNELQKKLSQEFDQKLREWEFKTDGETSKPRHLDDGDLIPKLRRTRDSVTVQLPSINDLSPEFKKKLNDWKKIKTSSSAALGRDDGQSQNLKTKIGEWQPWRSRSTVKVSCKGEQGYGDDLGKKGCQGKGSWSRRKDDDVNGRRDSKGKESIKKTIHSRSPSGGDSLLNVNFSEKDGRFNRRAPKMKDFQWVEKELQKIEREKMRLDQEREKYLEREARLEQMKRTMSTTFPAQEILVRTPTGFIRFKGISQKFTKKLYEWEKARGIAPEASTFALLQENAIANADEDEDADCQTTLQRSKSMGSVPELSSSLLIEGMVTHHPSSLSLNDVDDLKSLEKADEGDSLSSEQLKAGLDEEPQAIIVDVEDVVDETALVTESPVYKSEIPVYTYASSDLNRLTVSEERKQNHEETQQCAVERKRKEPVDDYKDVGVVQSATSDHNKTQIPAIVESKPDTDTEKQEKEQQETATRRTRPRTVQSWDESSNLAPATTEKEKVETTSRPDATVKQKSPVRKDPEEIRKKIREKVALMHRMAETKSHNWKYEFELAKSKQEERHRPIERHIPILLVQDEPEQVNVKSSPNVFVPTTRKIISPVKTQSSGKSPEIHSYVIDDVESEEQKGKKKVLAETKTAESNSRRPKHDGNDQAKAETVPKPGRSMPPLPNSPKSHKKETAPSIRMIIDKYNQKISERETASEKEQRSGSPKTWKSPVTGRRAQDKIDRHSTSDGGEIQKSASLDNVRSQSLTPKPPMNEDSGISKSNSAGVLKAPAFVNPTTERALKLQKAKEDFLSGRLSISSDSSPVAETQSAESSPPKSVSEEVAQTLSLVAPEPGGLQKSRFDMSGIKSRFRRIRMRRDKDSKLSPVAVLCRQSLVLDVAGAQPSEGLSNGKDMSKSCPSIATGNRETKDGSGSGDE